MKITREQFVRGITALRAHLDGARAICDVAERAGWRNFEVGDETLCDELVRQLRERCGDDIDQPIGNSNSLIEYAIWDADGPEDIDGEMFDLRIPEEVWRFWEQTSTGPFFVGAEHGERRP